jgi:2-C-methyl-D-erythritol 4-phosphate cytidylyltransferase
MDMNIPKQFLALAGKPMIMHTLERLDRIESVAEVILVCHHEYKELLSHHINAYRLTKKYVIVDGAQTRQGSSYTGVKHAENEKIIIHEAARPFVKEEEFEAIINNAADNAIYASSIPFTVLKGGECITELLNRNELLNVQLPQKFKKAPLLSAYEKATQENRIFTEDASMLFHYSGTPIAIMQGSIFNIKITTNLDLKWGEVIYGEYILERD